MSQTPHHWYCCPNPASLRHHWKKGVRNITTCSISEGLSGHHYSTPPKFGIINTPMVLCHRFLVLTLWHLLTDCCFRHHTNGTVARIQDHHVTGQKGVRNVITCWIRDKLSGRGYSTPFEFFNISSSLFSSHGFGVPTLLTSTDVTDTQSLAQLSGSSIVITGKQEVRNMIIC